MESKEDWKQEKELVQPTKEIDLILVQMLDFDGDGEDVDEL